MASQKVFSETQPGLETAEGDIDVIGMLLELWSRRGFIAATTLLATAAGLVYAFIASPVYHARAIISLKESGKGSEAARIFSQFGGVGGMVASHLGLGNTNLDKIEIILNGHELAESVIERNSLLPVLFQELWNEKDSTWIPADAAEIPNTRSGVRLLTKEMVKVSLNAKKAIITIGIDAFDSTLAKRLVEHYLVELNRKIREDVIRDSEANRLYLEKQLSNTLDPALREKIQSMIGFEVEKSMLVSSQAFEVLEKPIVPNRRTSPRKPVVVALSTLMGLFASITWVFGWNGLGKLRKAVSDRKLRESGD